MSEENRRSSRLVDVELQLMHLQKDFETLNEVVLQQGRQIDEQLVMLRRLSAKLNSDGQESSERDPDDEKPPHY